MAPKQERALAGHGLVLVAAPCCLAGRSHRTEGFVVSREGRSAVPPKAPTLNSAISNMLAEKQSSHRQFLGKSPRSLLHKRPLGTYSPERDPVQDKWQHLALNG